MSKMITLPQEILNQYTQEFYEILRTGKFSDGKINFTKTLGTVDRKATVLFTEMAWQKMQTLIREFDKEVAWHGVAERCEEKDTYLISDILVYPQEVTGSTVTTDQNEYEMWLMKQEDDVFNNIRMQGHSHVNMSTSPSSVDLNLYDGILSQLDSDMFYIFMIYNKRGEKTVKLYDLRENILFETADVTVAVKEVGDLTGFLEEAKELVVTTYQAISGAGKTFKDWPEMVENIIPFIGGEEEKSEQEPLRVLGRVENGQIVKADSPKITCQCVRVPVLNGHTAAVFINFEKKPTKEQLIEKLESFKGFPQEAELPSAPKQFIRYMTEDNRPQVKLDVDYENGMGISIGRLREDSLYDYKFIGLSHNTVRGAAGGAVLCAETLTAKGFITKK